MSIIDDQIKSSHNGIFIFTVLGFMLVISGLLFKHDPSVLTIFGIWFLAIGGVYYHSNKRRKAKK